MKKLLASMLCIAVPAFAQAPADAPIADAPGTSVLLKKGDPAPFDGRELSMPENLRRGKNEADCKATLADATSNGVLLPKAAVGTLIGGAAAAVIATIVLGVALATKK